MTGFINYYEVLGVAEDATQSDITKAYRRAAMKWHPDRYKGPDATDKMALINEAYCILRDAEARSKYDQELFRYKQISGIIQDARKPKVASKIVIPNRQPLKNMSTKIRLLKNGFVRQERKAKNSRFNHWKISAPLL